MKHILGGVLLFITASADAFQEYYEQGNFRQCVQQLASAEKHRQLSENELFFMAECSFQIGDFSRSSVYFNRLLKNNTGDTRRLIARMIDIYQNTSNDSWMEDVVKWLENNPTEDYQLSRLRTLFLQNGNLRNFSRLYRIRPYRLDEQTWTRLFTLGESEVRQIISIAPNSPTEKEIILIRFLYAKGDKVTAEKMLRAHPERKSREVRIALFELLSSENRREEAIAELADLARENPSLSLQISELLFEKGYASEAIEQLNRAEDRGFFYIDRKIFYLTAMARYRDALLELEQGRYSGKVPEFQYAYIRNELLRSWDAAEYVRVLSEFTNKIPGSCRTLIELGAGYPAILPDDQLHREIEHCNGLLSAPRRTTTLQLLFEKKRYLLITRLVEQRQDTDRFELFLRLKAHYHLREYVAAEQIISLLAQDNFWTARPEFRYYQGKIAMALKNYQEAALHFGGLSFEDSDILYLEALHAARLWDKLSEIIHSTQPPAPNELRYYKAIWSLHKLQASQAAILLEEYLNDPGIYGVRAVHLLFILKYFSDEKMNTALAANLALFPDYLNKDDWKLLNPDTTAKPETEFAAYCLYWQARWFLASGAGAEALPILANLKESQVAGFLQEEILYLTDNSRNGHAEFIRQFPSSPFRILQNP